MTRYLISGPAGFVVVDADKVTTVAFAVCAAFGLSVSRDEGVDPVPYTVTVDLPPTEALQEAIKGITGVTP